MYGACKSLSLRRSFPPIFENVAGFFISAHGIPTMSGARQGGGGPVGTGTERIPKQATWGQPGNEACSRGLRIDSPRASHTHPRRRGTRFDPVKNLAGDGGRHARLRRTFAFSDVPIGRHVHKALFGWAGLTFVMVGMLVLVSSAQASEQIDSFNTTTSTSQAGGHPDLETSFTLDNPGVPEAAQNVIFNAPQGVFGNANAITQCTSSDFALDQCPSSSQAGLITVYANYRGNPDDLLGTAPIFDLVPGAEQPALFSFVVPILNIPINIPLAVRTSTDYGLRFTVSGITEITPLAAADLTFWGFPAGPVHDPQRFPKGVPGEPADCVGTAGTSCIAKPTEAAISVHPLVDNPTTCTGEPLSTTLEVQTYQDPGVLAHRSDSYPATTGCEEEDFKPVLFASPTTNETDTASGLNVELVDPQPLGFAATPSEIHSATVALPAGFTVNPDAADGQSACTNLQANFGSEAPAACPDSAKIGTMSIVSPSLSGPLEGAVYFGEPEPGNQYRLFLIASGFGINTKFVGSVDPNPETGQVTATFENLPEVPFEDFDVHLFASERALMATPIACTIYTVKADFLPWNASLPDQQSSQIFGLDSGPYGSQCPGPVRPFNPRLVAGTSNPAAGAFSSFTLRLDREDGDQNLGKLNFTMPPGLTANLHGITYCPEAAIAAAAQTLGRTEEKDPSCPASSEIGTSNVAAGPGSHPFHAVGKVYMAGPFKGAPLSLLVVTPALAGPYDYGTVVVRVALHIDPLDAHVVADSETVPSIIGGIPLRMRSIQVNIDKPNFMINPTSCSPLSVASEGIGDQGATANFSSYFQAVNCVTLPFAPRMSITQLGGRKSTARSKDPSLAIELNTRPGDANIKSLSVTLPKAFEIDQRHLGNICDRSELASDQCAGRQPIGEAMTETPLLEKPLKGPVYAVSGFGVLPHLAFILGGQVTLDPRGGILLGPRRSLKDRRPGGSRCPDRALPLHPLRRLKGLPLKHPEPLQCTDRLNGRIQRPKRQDADPAGEDEDRV